MNYYFIHDDEGSILESAEYTNQVHLLNDCQKWANDCGCKVWVIQGRACGITCTPEEEGTIPPGALSFTLDDAKNLGFDTVDEYKAAYELESRKLKYWNEHKTLQGFRQ